MPVSGNVKLIHWPLIDGLLNVHSGLLHMTKMWCWHIVHSYHTSKKEQVKK